MSKLTSVAPIIFVVVVFAIFMTGLIFALNHRDAERRKFNSFDPNRACKIHRGIDTVEAGTFGGFNFVICRDGTYVRNPEYG